jgi:hypothetical protein
MSLELVNTLATFGTFLVIAATAIAAVVQLRHARSSNHIAALNELRQTEESPDFQAAQHFVITELPVKLQDPEFRRQYGDPSARTIEMRSLISKVNTIGNFYEGMGLLVKTGLVDAQLAIEMYYGSAFASWQRLAPMAAIARRLMGRAVWENFEYLTVLAEDWDATHPDGNYPSGARRIEIKDEWLDADKQYAASLAPA